MGLRKQEFPACCAGDIIMGFGNTRFALDGTSSPEAIDTYIKAHVEGYMRGYQGFSMITINHQQYPIVQPILRKYGFRKVAGDIFHPHHDSKIYVFMKIYQYHKTLNKKGKKWQQQQ